VRGRKKEKKKLPLKKNRGGKKNLKDTNPENFGKTKTERLRKSQEIKRWEWDT